MIRLLKPSMLCCFVLLFAVIGDFKIVLAQNGTSENDTKSALDAATGR